MDKQSNRGYLLWEMLVAIALVGIFTAWSAVEYAAFQDRQALLRATSALCAAIHQTQALAQQNRGAQSNMPTLHINIDHHPATYYVTARNKRIGQRAVLPEGISFSAGQSKLVQFQSNGRPMQSYRGNYQIVLENRHHERKKIIISAQTGRVRVQ